MKNKQKTLYSELSWDELVDKFQTMMELQDNALYSGDDNMAKAYSEQCEFIYKEFRKRGFRWKHVR